MKLKPISKEQNKRSIMIYYGIALIFLSIGFYTKKPIWNLYAFVILGLALFRKHWLMRRLKN